MKEIQQENKKSEFLACESRWTFWILSIVAGMFGAYTFIMRGGVFCNAQTANMVLMAIGFGRGDINKGIYYLLPILAFTFGSIVSDILARRIRDIKILRWDTIFVAIELILVALIAILDKNISDRVVQVAISFLCSIQFYTFRMLEGIPIATTFSTNNLRQFITYFIKFIKKREKESLRIAFLYFMSLAFFILGVVLMTITTKYLHYKSILVACPLLLVLFVYLLISDLFFEKEKFNQVPKGHD